ncbi:hypothetical protein DPMN_145441 [Dreissena polymorpha]|uniref:Uncharacterized protein n=1 Tax=Dreissena polymorpha TaxID=45954 RepID=A0A9D4F8E8_DREPO|nr:hypothetical protein DPMN_145441 [Dreissena polymorpha]
MPSLRSQSGWGTRLLVDFELLEVCNEAAFVQYSAILQAVCLKLEIYIADINDVVYVLVTTDLHMIPVGEHPESQFPHSLQQMFPGRVVGTALDWVGSYLRPRGCRVNINVTTYSKYVCKDGPTTEEIRQCQTGVIFLALATD